MCQLQLATDFTARCSLWQLPHSAATTSLLISLPVSVCVYHAASLFILLLPIVFVYVNKRTSLHMQNCPDKAVESFFFLDTVFLC